MSPKHEHKAMRSFIARILYVIFVHTPLAVICCGLKSFNFQLELDLLGGVLEVKNSDSVLREQIIISCKKALKC